MAVLELQRRRQSTAAPRSRGLPLPQPTMHTQNPKYLPSHRSCLPRSRGVWHLLVLGVCSQRLHVVLCRHDCSSRARRADRPLCALTLRASAGRPAPHLETQPGSCWLLLMTPSLFPHHAARLLQSGCSQGSHGCLEDKFAFLQGSSRRCASQAVAWFGRLKELGSAACESPELHPR